MSEQFSKIPIDSLVYSGRNPRTEIRGIKEFAESIKEYGMLQPIIVRPKEEKFEVVVGERRVRAAIIAGLREVPTIIRDLTDRQTDELRLIENIHRDDLTDAEKGDAVYGLLENYPEKYRTITSVAEAINTPHMTVRMWIRKSRKLSNHLNELISENLLKESHALQLLKYDNQTQNKLADTIIRNKILTYMTPKFLRLYDANPEANLADLADEAKGAKKVQIEIEELSGEAKREVEKIIEEKKKLVEKTRKKAAENARKAIRRPKSDIPIMLEELKPSPAEERLVRKTIRKILRERGKRSMMESKFAPLQLDVVKSSIWHFKEMSVEGFQGKLPDELVRNLIELYSDRGDLVLDSFCGYGTIMSVACKLERDSVGVDINPSFQINILGDARKLCFSDSCIDLIIAQPPYWDAIKYSNLAGDLSNIDLFGYLKGMKDVFQEMHYVLKEGKYCCVVIGDRRKKGKLYPLHSYLIQIGEKMGFELYDIIIWVRYQTRFMHVFDIKTRHSRIDHNYILVFKKLRRKGY